MLNEELKEKIDQIEGEIKTYENKIKEQEKNIEELNNRLKSASEQNLKDVIKLYIGTLNINIYI